MKHNNLRNLLLQINGMEPDADIEALAQQELSLGGTHILSDEQTEHYIPSLYDYNDLTVLQQLRLPNMPAWLVAIRTLDDLLEQDKRREADGFPRRIRIGRIAKPQKGTKSGVVIVPSTTEPKFYHDDSITDEEEQEETTGGTGEEGEGEILGEQQAQPEQGEGEGNGAGQGNGSGHDVTTDAFDLGKVLTQRFQLPNLRQKGTKRSITQYTYELTDSNRGFGQLLDKHATIKRVISTNIVLGNISEASEFDPSNLVINPQDKVFRVMSQEKDYEAQAAVFFVRDYSGSMQGKPTEAVTTQHLLIYSWLMYQYQRNVLTRFIVHDTEAKEVPDFYSYYKYQVAGGTNVYPAFELVHKIVTDEQLSRDYNIYVFYGTDGDDWEQKGTRMIEALKEIMRYSNRIGITVAKNGWTSENKMTNVEQNMHNSGLLKEHPELIRMDSFVSANAEEERLIQGIKTLIS